MTCAVASATYAQHGPATFGAPEAARGNPSQSAATNLQSAIRFGVLMCSAAYDMAKSTGDSSGPSDHASCVMIYRPVLEKWHGAAVKETRTASRKAAITGAYAAGVEALAAVAPGPGEGVIGHRRRVAELNGRLEAALAKMDVAR